jgi:hypothetical protein
MLITSGELECEDNIGGTLGGPMELDDGKETLAY